MGYSIHCEIYPLDLNFSYLFICKLNDKPQLNSLYGWELFCSSRKNNVYTHFIDTHQTLHDHSIVHGIRELNFKEMNDYCLNETISQTLSMINEFVKFSSDYKICIYQSSMNNNLQSDRLLVVFR